MAGRSAWLFSVKIKSAAAAMEQRQERPVAGAEACGEERGLSRAAEERIEDRISLLLRCSRRASALTREAQGSKSVSLVDLRLRALRHYQCNRFRPVGKRAAKATSPPRREKMGLRWDSLRKCVARLATRPPVLSRHCGPCWLSSTAKARHRRGREREHNPPLGLRPCPEARLFIVLLGQ